MSTETTQYSDFERFGLPKPLMKALDDVGYETPSPIQARVIPPMMAGKDVIGQAQTGTGKTAAFALPLLANLDIKRVEPQVLVLTPTRELAIQVAEAFQRYGSRMKGMHVAPIYGGQDYGVQLRQLKRGVHIVVGTPGRVMDHMRRGTLTLDSLMCLVLDEADEMLRMGFIDDVEWVLEQTPPSRQTALFSATMPPAIRKIAERYMRNPEYITIKVRTTTAETINQRYWVVNWRHKLDALTRILEAEPFDGMLVFVRTKVTTLELAEKLEARGYACAPLNGDIKQNQRERTVDRFKKGQLDILVATDVAARGLDVDRISHVVNYDMPLDTETYVHRVGRTGRAGRRGEAILFATPREKNMLSAIEKATRQKIALLDMPSNKEINNKRLEQFKQRITDTLASDDLDFYIRLVEEYKEEHDVSTVNMAAALAKLLQGDAPLLVSPEQPEAKRTPKKQLTEKQKEDIQASDMEVFRIEVGYAHGVKAGNIVGAIANEAGLDSGHIGSIEIFDGFSLVELPSGMPKEIFKHLKAVWVSGQQLNISRVEHGPREHSPRANSNKSGPRNKRQDVTARKHRKVAGPPRSRQGRRKTRSSKKR